MSSTNQKTSDVRRYVQGNDALKLAVGAYDDAVIGLEPLGMGEHNLNYRLDVRDRSFVLRVNVAKQPFHDDQVSYEFSALEVLVPCGRVPEPVYLDSSSNALGEGVLVESFCEGDMLDFDHLRPGDLRCAAQIMADVHSAAVPHDCLLHRPADPLRDLMSECIERFELYRRSTFEDARITGWARRFIEAAQRALEAAPPPCDCEHIVNTETLPSHFLIPAASASSAAANDTPLGAFCACPGFFVDWERPIVGEVAQDVAYFVSPTTTFWDSEYLFPANGIDSFV
ncbi:MAG: phosphotransferase, partial [Eggerthellaceae bacterium]|nr:phosphotransferase [Eggerthellaceae bacterium]